MPDTQYHFHGLPIIRTDYQLDWRQCDAMIASGRQRVAAHAAARAAALTRDRRSDTLTQAGIDWARSSRRERRRADSDRALADMDPNGCDDIGHDIDGDWRSSGY